MVNWGILLFLELGYGQKIQVAHSNEDVIYRKTRRESVELSSKTKQELTRLSFSSHKKNRKTHIFFSSNNHAMEPRVKEQGAHKCSPESFALREQPETSKEKTVIILVVHHGNLL